MENGIKINPGKSKAKDLRELGLKIHSVTLFVTKKFWKRAVVNNGE